MELPFWEEKTKTRQDERMVKLKKKIQKCRFWTYIQKQATHSLFGAWSFLLLIHIRFTPSEGPKDFVNVFF